MTIEEVIAIAKTLRPDLLRVKMDTVIPGQFWIDYEGVTFYGNTPEECLRDAGWKPKASTVNDAYYNPTFNDPNCRKG